MFHMTTLDFSGDRRKADQTFLQATLSQENPFEIKTEAEGFSLMCVYIYNLLTPYYVLEPTFPHLNLTTTL